MLVSMLAVLVLLSELKAQPPNSAANSPSSAIRANSAAKGVVNACAAAVEDLAATRKLADALERENAVLGERLETARRVEALLNELNASRRNENEALLAALKAKNETIAAKDHALARQDEQITELKRKRSSPLKRLGDILIGVAVTAILK
ncbi:MAG TPA: hypothetical protein PKD26_15460 [Pyrinomonadaceae bacterium]|nr:hypothetical protein [Pyrinomonadaceae bacterium]